MTTEEKAKRYDEVLPQLKGLLDGIHEEKCDIMEEDIIKIFPELKESEDEKIRKWIIDDIRYNMNNEPLNNSEYRKKADKAIVWLEKQKKCSGENEEKIDRAIWLIEHYATHGHDKELREGVISGLESLKRK